MADGPSIMSHRTIYSGWDFQQALSALNFLIQECEYDKKYSRNDLRRFRCYETTLITSFVRPFKVGRGRKQFDLSTIGFELTADDAKIIDKLMRLRDKVVSHSDEEEMEYRAESIKLLDNDNIRMPILQFREALYLGKDELIKIQELLHRIIRALAEYQFKIVQSDPNYFSKFKASAPIDLSKKV